MLNCYTPDVFLLSLHIKCSTVNYHTAEFQSIELHHSQQENMLLPHLPRTMPCRVTDGSRHSHSWLRRGEIPECGISVAGEWRRLGVWWGWQRCPEILGSESLKGRESAYAIGSWSMWTLVTHVASRTFGWMKLKLKFNNVKNHPRILQILILCFKISPTHPPIEVCFVSGKNLVNFKL